VHPLVVRGGPPIRFRRASLTLAVVGLLLPLVAAAPATASDGFPVRSSVAGTADPRPDVRFVGSGWGHGVGMSQYGARAMAVAGHDAGAILQHYYRGTELGKAATTAPIRVGLRQGVSGTRVTATGGDVRWDACPDTPGGRTPDQSCERVRVQPQGTTWHVCPISNGNQRVQDAPCGEPFQALWASSAPVLRVQHHGTTITTPGPQGSTFQRGSHDIIRPRDHLGQLLSSYHTVQNLPSVEQYLLGLAEVPTSWEAPALRAQAITGRTYALRTAANRPSCRCDIFATPTHQAYGGAAPELGSGGAWRRAVEDTAEQVLTHGGVLAETFYSSSHGGRSENVEDSWAYGTTPIPYLRSVEDPWSLASGGNPCTSWERRATTTDAASLFGAAIPQTLQRLTRVRILSRTQGGTPRELEVRGVDTTGTTREFVFTRPVDSSGKAVGKPIAGAHVRSTLTVTHSRGGWTAPDACFRSTRTPSSQIRSIGFAPFHDDDGTTHEYSTVWANAAGIASGTSTTTFHPTRNVTRAQMATFINNTFTLPAATTHHFDDVSPTDTHARSINALAEAGIASGTGDRRFSPDAPVTRAQMATFLAKAAGWARPSGVTRFTDVPAGSTHASAIAAIDREGVTSGCAADRYCPLDHVTRGQMTAFLYRLVRG
jgi:SpoIID/LytB domain protein